MGHYIHSCSESGTEVATTRAADMVSGQYSAQFD
jgi:hypothetical protein